MKQRIPQGSYALGESANRVSRFTPYVSRFVLLAVLLLAAALRWAAFGLVEFKYDEANITRIALGVANGESLPLLSGGTTLGIQRPALDVYLMALPLRLGGGHIEAAVWGLSALGVIAVALTYALGRRIGGSRVGLGAALFMAANPWLIGYDRKLWAHIQAAFSVLLLLLAWEVIVRRRGRAAFWFPVVAALQGLSHVLAAVQVLSWLAAFAVAPRRWLRRQTAWGALLGIGLLAPYGWALARWWLTQPHDVAAAVAAAQPKGAALLAALRDAVYLFTGAGINSLLGLPVDHSLWWRLAYALHGPALLMLAAGLVRTVLWARRGEHILTARLLLAWTGGPVLLFLTGPVRVWPQYWTVLLPLPGLYLALGLDGLAAGGARWAGRIGRGAAVNRAIWSGALATLALVWSLSHVAVLAGVAAGAGGATFGVPLARWRGTLAVTQDWAARLGTQEVRVAVDGIDPGYDNEPAAVALLIGNPPWARFVAPQTPASLLLAQDRPSLYLWAIQDPGTEALLDRAGTVVWEAPLGEGHAPARLYRLPAAADADLGLAVTRLDPAPTFDAGIALLGYAFPADIKPEAEAVVTLIWRVLEPPAAVRQRDFTAFNHVVTGSGEKVAQVDGLALLSRDWWPGDVLVQRYAIVVLKPGAYTWRVGLYSRTDGGRAQLLTGGDAVDLGPLLVR